MERRDVVARHTYWISPMKKLELLVFGWAVAHLYYASLAWAQTPQTVRMAESFQPGYQYHVSCRVNITGTLKTPDEKEKQMALTGSSAIEFDERVLVEK